VNSNKVSARALLAAALLAVVSLLAQTAGRGQAQSQPTTPYERLPMELGHAFFVGVLGALLGYIVLYRETRIAEFAKAPGQNWKILLFDLVVYLLCGGLVTAFLVGPYTPKEAFTGGLAWQGIAGGAVAGTELATYKKAGGK
jgi:hypothetical protein